MVSVVAGFAQLQGPALSVDAGAGRHAISPDVYGINFYWDLGTGTPTVSDLAAALDIRPTARRWGGNGTSTYHWKFDVQNTANDWFYEVLPDTTESFNHFADRARQSGGEKGGGGPGLGRRPKAPPGR